MERMTEKQWFLPVLILIIIFVSLLPVLFQGIPDIDDSAFHISWSYHFADQLKQGDPYPRFLTGVSNGFGGPVFYYYAPLPYFINSVIFLLFDGETNTALILGTTILLSFLLGALGTYKMTKEALGISGALCAALAYSVLPHHLLINVYSRSAFAEIFAMGILPFLFVSWKHWWKTALAVALMFVTHPPTAMISIPAALLFRLIQNDSAMSRFQLLTGFTIGGLLASFYLLPALLVENPALELLWDKGRAIPMYFPRTGSKFETALFLSILVTIGVCVSAISVKSRKGFHSDRAWLVLFLVSVFFISPLSYPVYRFTPLSKIQFPWRFMTLCSLAAAWYIGSFFASVRSALLRSITVVLLSLGSLVFIPLLLSGNLKFHSDDDVRQLIDSGYNAREYMIVGDTPKEFLDNDVRILSSGVLPRIVDWSEDRIELNGKLSQGKSLTLRRGFFGEWSPADDLEDTAEVIRSDSGLLQVRILRETDRVVLIQSKMPSVIIGRLISIATLLSLIMMAVMLSIRRRIGREQ